MKNRIRELRHEKGPEWTLTYVAKLAHTTPKQLSRLERGQRSLTLDWIERVAKALECDPLELISDYKERYLAPVVGYIGAGDLYYPEPKSGPWIGFNEVETPPGMVDAVAVIIRGESMKPVYHSGDMLFFNPTEYPGVEQYAGKECVVKLQNGMVYLKRVHKKSNGSIQLLSYNEDPIEDANIAWAAPVKWICRA